MLATIQAADWIDVVEDPIVQDLGLDPGETAAILLAEKVGAEALLIDERRGRVVVARGIAASSAEVCATLPCRHHPRSSQHLLNQLLLSGLQLGTTLARDHALKGSIHRLTRVLADTTRPVPLHAGLFETARRQINRLTRTYEPALRSSSSSTAAARCPSATPPR